MDAARENKIFLTALWIFLVSAIAFYFIYISSGRMFLPASLWASLLLIDAGFIVFLFVPLHGRQRLGGRMEPRRREWYPRDLGEIVEKPESGAERRPELLRPGRPVDPVPLIPLIILLFVIILSAPFGRSEKAWTHNETERLMRVYGEAETELADLERKLGEACESAGGICAAAGMGGAESYGPARIRLIHSIDSLATAASEGIEPVGGLGIQVFGSDGDRLAWGGTPRYAGRIEGNTPDTRVFIARTRLFTLLVRDIPLDGGGRVVADLPLEVNYRISNRFLRSTSLGEMIGAEHGADVEFSYWVGGRPVPSLDGEGEEPAASTTADGSVRVMGIVSSSGGQPLARLAVMGDTYISSSSGASDEREAWAGLLLTLCAVVIARWTYNRYGKRRRHGDSRSRGMLRRTAMLAFFLIVIRYLLLRLDMPTGLFGVDLFDPALFADEMPGGLMRNAGDYLISSVFLLIFVFGTVKSYRAYYSGRLERPVTGAGRFNPLRMIARTAVLWVVMAGAALASASIVSRTVLNSNPRLIGLDAQFFSLPALTLHAAMLYSVAAVFIAAVFVMRLALGWGGSRRGEVFFSAAAALAVLWFFPNPHWSALAASVGLLLLSARVFPMLRREELLSVVFASFFLVIICSVVIFGVGAGGYDDLRRGKVIEAAEEINNPEDTWFQIILPDMMEEMAGDRSLVSKVMSHGQAAAFEIWARSVLSEFGSPCVFEVFDSEGTRFSRFSVGIPFEIRGALEDPAGGEEEIADGIVRMVGDSDYGRVFYFVGTTPISHPDGRIAGKVAVKLPYHYENPSMLTSAGPTAPEILRNVERGSVAPRVDEPEKLLVARVSGGVIVDSSDPSMRPGEPVPASEGEWFTHDSGDGTYNCIYIPGRGESQYIAGYLTPGFNGSMLTWATIVSVEMLLTLVSLVILLIVRKLPIFGSVTPDVSMRGGLGFRRKLLLSFAVVSMIPVILMGIFSSRYVRYRYRAVSETEAREAAASAGALVRSRIRSEAEAFSRSRLLSDLLQAGGKGAAAAPGGYGESVFTLIGGDGDIVLGDEDLPGEAAGPAAILKEAGSGRVTVTWTRSGLYAGTVVPFSLPQGGDGYLYYRRRLDDDLIGRTASVLGRNLNVYYGGTLQASSERELFVGGFLGTLLAPPTYANVALGGSRTFITSESLGDYSYQVSSIGIPPLMPGESAVLSVPLLYRTAVIQSEVIRTSAVLLGLLALILCVAVTLGVFLAGRIFNPIADLMTGTRRIMRGDLEFRIESPATDEIGDLVTSFNSMTEALRTARRNLLERQRYLAAVLDNIATGVISADSGGTIVTLNPAGERILGVKREDLVGRKPAEAAVPGLDKFFGLFSDEKGGTGGIAEKEIALEHDGERRTLKTVVAGLAEGGENLGTVVVFDDLTELIRSKKLSAWIEMARQIAHEVKNPLTPIKLSAQLMKRAYTERSEEFGDIFSSGIDTVIQQTEILRQIASEFSSFGRTVDLKREKIKLAGFIDGVIAGYRGAEDVAIAYLGGPGSAIADKEALRKIIVNLVENALEAIQGEGKITVTHEVSGGTATIRVVDTGTGLSGEAEVKLFEPYFSTKTNGTGLGLAICQSLAREMDGEIVLRNRGDGPGVEAIVMLPGIED